METAFFYKRIFFCLSCLGKGFLLIINVFSEKNPYIKIKKKGKLEGFLH